MSTNIVVPELGESIVEATVIRWFKSEGDSVKIGEALLELETEKANFEIAAEKPGIIKTILKRDNDDVEVGEVLGVLEEADASSAVQAEVVKEEIDEQPQPKEEVLEKITPVARRLAEEFDVDLSKVGATGTSGRITKEDVERYIQMEVEESEIEASSVEPIHKAPAVITPTLAIARDVREERIKMSRRRRTIAAHFCKKLKKEGDLKLIKQGIKTSPRRFLDGGIYKVLAGDIKIWFLDLIGVRVEKYADAYWRDNKLRTKNR